MSGCRRTPFAAGEAHRRFRWRFAAAGFFAALVSIAGGEGAAGQTTGGLSYDEYRRTFPPAPVKLQVEIGGSSALLLWELPDLAEASQPLAYDPAIAGFRIFRLAPDGGETLAAETKGTFLRLPWPAPGITEFYAVKTLQRSGHESGLSAEVAVSR